jgi:predicted RND superfamily exporter protein
MDPKSGAMLFTVTSEVTSTDAMHAFRERIVSIAQESTYADHFGIRVGNDAAQYPDQDMIISQGFVPNTIMSLLLVAILGTILLHKWLSQSLRGIHVKLYAGMLISLPFLFSTASVIIMMATLGMTLEIATSTIIPIVVSAAIDLPMFLIVAYLVENQTQADHESIICGKRMHLELEKFCTDFLANTLAFVPLAIPVIAYFPLIERLGILLTTAMLGCFIGTLMMLSLIKGLRRPT